MSLRYLFGPVDAAFADENLSGPRQAGLCRTFDWRPGADLLLEPSGGWESLTSDGTWRPDVLVLFMQYRVIPEWLWDAPVPIIALAGDWNLLWHHYRRSLWRADRVLTDAAGVEALTNEGMTHARSAILYGLGRSFVEESWASGERDIDVLFVGNFHAAIQRERLAGSYRTAREPLERAHRHGGSWGCLSSAPGPGTHCRQSRHSRRSEPSHV